MKRLPYVLMAVLAVIILRPINLVFAQKSQSPPQVPITYPGDTDETIKRRAQWIERAKAEGRVAFWGTPRPQLMNVVISEFNKIYPFVTVDYWSAPESQMAAKWEAEFSSRSSTADVTLGGSTELPRWRKMGMLAKLIDEIPRMKKLDKRMYGKNGDWVVPGHSSLAPQYNTKLISAAEAPKSWEDLLDPKWKGHIGITTDVKAWYTLALGGGWGIEKTEDFLRRLRQQNLIWGTGHSSGVSLLTAGELKIHAELFIYNVPLMQAKGAPIEWVRANPVVVAGAPMVINTKSPHPNAARLFVEWVLSPQGLVAFEKGTNYGSAFPGANTLQSRMVKGLDLAVLDEEVSNKAEELGLVQKFSEALGIKQ